MLMSKFNRLSRNQVKKKSPYEIVTLADTEAEKIIIDDIKSRFPHDTILSEEAGREEGAEEYLWIIDPLDGTTNFFIGNPVFTSSIGLAYKGEMISGATYHPILKELFFVEKGKGFLFILKRLFTILIRQGHRCKSNCLFVRCIKKAIITNIALV